MNKRERVDWILAGKSRHELRLHPRQVGVDAEVERDQPPSRQGYEKDTLEYGQDRIWFIHQKNLSQLLNQFVRAMSKICQFVVDCEPLRFLLHQSWI